MANEALAITWYLAIGFSCRFFTHKAANDPILSQIIIILLWPLLMPLLSLACSIYDTSNKGEE